MRVPTRALDRRVTIMQRVNVRDPVYRTDTAKWVPLAIVSAEVQDMLPSRAERIAEGVNIAQRPCRVRMRWRGDVTAQMRLKYRGEIYRIISGPTELGRREGMELLAEILTTEGQEP